MKHLTHLRLVLTLALLALANHTNAADVKWAVGNANWDAVTLNWLDNAANPTNYVFGQAVLFDDTASGATPIFVTNTIVVTNGSITVSNVTKNYTLTGAGLITNNVPILKLGTNTLTLASANTNYDGTFTLGAGKLIMNTGSSLGGASTGSQLVMSNNTSLQIGNGTTFTPGVPIVVAAGANVTLSTGNGLSSGPNGSVTSGDANAVLNVSGGFSFGGNLQGFLGTVRVNTAFPTRFNKGGAGATDLGSSNAIFIVNSSAPGLRPRNNNTTVHLGALSGTGTLGGAQTPTGANTTTYQIGALNLSTTFGGQFVDNISPSTNVAIVKVGTGMLTLTNHSPHTGATTVSNGMLTLVTSGSLSNSPVTVTSGATNGMTLATAGGSTTVSNLTYAPGTEYAVFDFGANAPSTTTAPLQVQNNLAINGTLNISVTGSTIPPGIYPLIQYGGFAGTAPTVAFSLPPATCGSISNDSITTKTLYLVVRPPQIVTTAADSGAGSLRQVMTDSISGDTVVFDNSLSGSTIQLNTEIALTKRLIIDASSLAGGITIRGKADQGAAGNFRLFNVTGAGDLTLGNLTLAYGGGTALGGNGGAIYTESPVTLTGCTLRSNQADNNGGAIFNLSATAKLSLTHCTFTANTCAAAYGGAVCNDSGSVSVTHSTFTGNSAPAGNGEGGGIFNYLGSLAVTNSIIAGNTATTSGGDIQNYGTVTFAGANIVQAISGTSTGPAPLNAAPLLAPLGNYGGPTQTMPPLPGSPAIDAGAATTLTTDQRGFARSVGAAVDIGAVEVNLSPVVLNNNDSGAGSLRQAVADADSGATITFTNTLSGQTILLTSGQLLLNKNLTIDASALTNGISINGNNASRIFLVGAGVTNVLNSLTITNGNDTGPNAGGGGILSFGTLTLNNCSLKGNLANQVGWGGGGILNFGGTLTVNQSTFSGNAAVSVGGGILNNGTLTVNQSTLSGNSAGAFGGGIGNGGPLNLTNSIVAGNTALSDPNINGSFSGNNNFTSGNPLLAPLGNYGGPTLTMPPLPGSPAIDGCTSGTAFTTDQRGFARPVGNFADIGAVESGNAIPGYTYGTVVNTTADFLNGSETNLVSLRNAVVFGPTNATITFDPSLSDQTILLTSGQLLLDKNLTIDGSSLASAVQLNGNNASRIFEVISGSTVELTALTITNGSVPGNYGGGIFNNGGALTLNRCTIAGNTGYDGGGLDNEPGSSLTLNQCTVVGNSAADQGGGIWNEGTLTVNQSTISGNSANVGGGIWHSWVLNLTNSIVCNNTAASNTNISGSIASGVNNLVDANALLAPLGNYGGPTMTMPPLPSSPAIDGCINGVDPSFTTDQRGLPRIVGPFADIGAVEVNLSPVVINNHDSGAGSLRQTVAESDLGANITFTNTLSGQTILLTSGQIMLDKNLAIDASD